MAGIKQISLIFMVLGAMLLSQPAFAGWWQFWHPDDLSATYGINEDKILGEADGLSLTALQLGVQAYEHAVQDGLDRKGIITIVDFSKPSTVKRLWVIDLKRSKVIYNTWVAHGENSGRNYATRFSNVTDSRESSLGLYVTGSTYVGNLGYSMRLYGITPGYNTNAYNRDIVMHGAWYVGEQVIREYGHLGFTWGCFGINPDVLHPIIDKIQNGTLLLAYYPDSSLVRIADKIPDNVRQEVG